MSQHPTRRQFVLGAAGAGLSLSVFRSQLARASAAVIQPGSRDASGELSYDVVIYGANLAGIMAAVRAHLRGLSVCVIEPTGFVGGIIAGGLVYSDTPLTDLYSTPEAGRIVGGLTASKFFQGIGAIYGNTGPYVAGDKTSFAREFHFEPHIAMQVSVQLLQEAGASVITGSPLGHTDVHVTRTPIGNTISSIHTRQGMVSGKVFVDASYEGDLLAYAGVSYAVGRENTGFYGESYAGFYPAGVVTLDGVSDNTAYPTGAAPTTAPGDSDAKLQSYNFRCVVTQQANNLIPFSKPDGYDARKYSIVLDEINNPALKISTFLDVVGDQGALLNTPVKYQTNSLSGSVLGTDLPGRNWAYADATWRQRQDIIAEHVSWQQGLCYWVMNDPDGPRAKLTDTAPWGLAADEFPDSPYGAGWPHALYIREARRMVGDYVMTQKDQNGSGAHKDAPVCVWQYARDSHIVQLYPGETGQVVAEGGLGTPNWSSKPNGQPNFVDAYHIPFSSLVPKPTEITNLTVPVCMSASHIGYCTTRLEPAFGMMGEACGEIAALAIANGTTVQDVLASYQDLRASLLQYGTVLDIPAGT